MYDIETCDRYGLPHCALGQALYEIPYAQVSVCPAVCRFVYDETTEDLESFVARFWISGC